MTEHSLQSMMQQAIDAFQPEKASGIDVQIQLKLTGDQGGDWAVTIRDQKLSVVEQVLPDADLSFQTDAKDLASIASGSLSPMTAVMQGKVKFKGDLGLAMKLLEVFKLPSSWK